MRATLQSAVDALAKLARPLAWAVLLWVVVLLLPWLELREVTPALDSDAVRALVLLPPLASLWAAFGGKATTLLGVALAGLVPALVAIPELVERQDLGLAGAVRGVAVAAVLVLLIASTLDRDPHRAPLRTLWRWPARGADRALWAVGLAWLVIAWWGADGARTGRVAAAGVCWVAVVLVPVGAGHRRLEAHGWRWLFARALWIAAVALLWRFGRPNG